MWPYSVHRENFRSATFMVSKREFRKNRYRKIENISLSSGKTIVCREADNNGHRTRSSIFYNASSK